jgi:hypothetical protein
MADKAQAILKINSNAQFTITDGVVEWLDGTTPISDADIKAKLDELKTIEANEQAQKETDALAGNNKLLELGLTQAQVTAMTGYTPPAEV